MGQPRVLGQRKGRDGKPRHGPGEDEGQSHAQCGRSRGIHSGAECKIPHEIGAQANDGKGTAVGIRQDLPAPLRGCVTCQCVAGIGIAVQVDAARHRHRQQAQSRAPQQLRQGQAAAKSRPAPPQRPQHQPHQGKGAHGIAHVPLVPDRLRHRQRREHGEGHGGGLQDQHRSPPL